MASFTAVLTEEDGGYVSHCPEVGTTSQGDTVEEALANLKEATELYLEEFPEKKFTKSVVKTFEVIESAKV